MRNIQTKKNIQQLQPYTCARDNYKKGIFFDANENYSQWTKINWSEIKNLNRYPDSTADKLRKKLTEKYVCGFNKNNIFVGCGSDEIIYLLIQAFVESNEAIMTMNPSYGVYAVQAAFACVQNKKILLNPDFSLNIQEIQKKTKNVKIIFLCSPNNPTGNLVSKNDIEEIFTFFNGILVIDEAYIEFAGLKNSLNNLVLKYDNIVILRTFSKAWGLAGIRVGYAIANSKIIDVLLKTKESYNVTKPSQLIALQALDQTEKLKESVKKTMQLKTCFEKKLKNLGLEIIPTKANFILIRIKNATNMYQTLANKRLIVRDRSSLPYLKNVLRITTGSKKENDLLVQTLQELL